MIEVIYKEDTTEQEAAQESFSMPRNVRQIGLANGDYRIYNAAGDKASVFYSYRIVT